MGKRLCWAKKSAGEPREGANTITFTTRPIRISSKVAAESGDPLSPLIAQVDQLRYREGRLNALLTPEDDTALTAESNAIQAIYTYFNHRR